MRIQLKKYFLNVFFISIFLSINLNHSAYRTAYKEEEPTSNRLQITADLNRLFTQLKNYLKKNQKELTAFIKNNKYTDKTHKSMQNFAKIQSI